MSEKLDYLSMTPENQKAYNKYLEDLASDRGALEFAKSEGKIEEKIEIAINLLKEGSDIAFISKVTGLTIEEINKL